MDYSRILVEEKAGVLTIKLNRPEVLNSFDCRMGEETLAALDSASRGETIRAVLLTGSGRAFCTGQDLSDLPPLGDAPPQLGKIVERTYTPLVRAIRSLEKPVVCAVNGVAAGAGANLALCCDLVLASQEAYFAQSFCKVGLVPDTGGSFFLPRLVGLARATSMLFLGEKVSAQQAFDLGMIYKVCAPDELAGQALELAERLACQPTKALAMTKDALNRSLGNDLMAQLELEKELQDRAGRTSDYSEGVRAFLEKRKPNFTGR